MGGYTYIDLLIDVVVNILTILVSFYFYKKYKQATKEYKEFKLNKSYDFIFHKIKENYQIDHSFKFTRFITEISLITKYNKILIPEKYKQCSLWSLALIYREIDVLISRPKSLFKFHLRNLINGLCFFYLMIIGWILIGLTFMYDSPIFKLYVQPLILIALVNYFANYRDNKKFESFIKNLDIEIDNVEVNLLLKWVYWQPLFLFLTAASRQVVVVKWLFSNDSKKD